MSFLKNTNEFVEKYRGLLETALKTIKINIENPSFLKEVAEDYYMMANSYLKDGISFQEKNDLNRALVCFSYAYGWVDAGVRLGLFYGVDNKLFTLYK